MNPDLQPALERSLEERGETPVTRSTIWKKLHACMRDLAYIQKDSENRFHGYRYASEAAIKNAVHAAFVRHGLVMLVSIVDTERIEAPPTSKGKQQWITKITIEYRFVDTDTGDERRGLFSGQGIDGEDKGLYKAITGALKYLLTTTFLIETGDDPEQETDQGQRVKAAQRKSIARASEQVGIDSKGTFDINRMIAELQKQKQRLIELGGDAGERKYREILGDFGCAKANDKKLMADPDLARNVWRALVEAVVSWREFSDEFTLDGEPDEPKNKGRKKAEQPPQYPD